MNSRNVADAILSIPPEVIFLLTESPLQSASVLAPSENLLDLPVATPQNVAVNVAECGGAHGSKRHHVRTRNKRLR